MRVRTFATAALVALAGAAAAQAPAGGWPRAIPVEQGTLTIYEPQLEKLEGLKLSGRAAVSWEAKGKGGAPVFGVFWFEARVLVDKERRTVQVEQLDVTKVRFPNATPEQAKRVEELVEAQVPRWDLSPSLDAVLAAIAASQRLKQSEKGIKATPPKLLVSYEPAVLLLYDGAPAVRSIADAGLDRVVNTPLFVVRDPATGRFYLGSDTLWYEAPDPKGPWALVGAPNAKVKAFFDAQPRPGAEAAPPQSASPAASQPATAQPAPPQPAAPQPGAPAQQPGVPAQQPAAPPKAPSSPPKIVVATEPTELIVFDGKPAWVPLGADGKLLYADNSDTDVLVSVPTNETFVLVSGRWYKAASLAGPWTPVRPDRLPSSFKSIPPDSAMGDVRTFVTGTGEAEDALADSQIPQTAAVKREQALRVTYDGEPRFKAIEGTQLAYAVNTPFSVIRDSGQYWACHQGVWYVAASPEGPWTVSDRRPPSVDQIPPSAPVYNVKYVYVYQSTPEEVYVGYLPGYTGVYPYYGTMVYGTGWYYPPYIGAAFCYPYPATFGFHVAFSPWTGFGVGVSWGTPFFSVGVAFGGYGRFYGPVGFRAPFRPVYGYRPPPAGYRSAYGRGYAAGRATAAGARPPAAAAQANLYQRGGGAGRSAPTASPQAPRTAATAAQPNNVYGDRAGNVYRQNPGGDWQKNTASGWQGTSPAASAPAGLSADAAARSRAASAPAPSAAGRMGGGGFRGGGGRR
jgi:hypothetical protein